jgi:hypothetical protein
VNKGAAINEPSVVSLRKGALLNVVWAGEELLKDLRAGVNRGVEEKGRRVAGLNGGHETKVRVGSLTKATWRDRTQEEGME